MAEATRRHRRSEVESDGVQELRRSPTMARLLDAMEVGTDIGHYGQFTFVTVARHFMSDEKIIEVLVHQPDMDEAKAHALLLHVQARGYNPPQRERIIAQQERNGFQIIPNTDDPDSGNLYRELEFPDEVYDDINHYYVEKAEIQ